MNKFKKLDELYKNKEKYANLVSENIKTLKVRHGDRKCKIIRDGKEVLVQEKVLWEEIWQLGTLAIEATKIMKGKYPELFVLVDKDVNIAKDIKFFTLKNFGFDSKAMTLGNYISLTKELIRHEIVKINYIAKIIGVLVLLAIAGFLIRGIF